MDTKTCFLLNLLPIAIMHEILFRLPIKSILNVKLVCKSLYNLVSHPDFSVNYSKKSPFATFLVPVPAPDQSNYHPEFYLLEIPADYSSRDDHDYIRITTIKPNLLHWSNSELSIVGTLNGLVCLVLCKRISRKRLGRTDVVYICNPITGERSVVAKYTRKLDEVVSYGFGFCKSTNNYKVLKLVNNSRRRFAAGKGEILTIGVDDTWRVLNPVANPAIAIPLHRSGLVVNVNEYIYWIFITYDKICIASFDLVDERIRRLSFPREMPVDDHHHITLRSIDNQLCIVCITCKEPKIIIWKLKKCRGVANSWTNYIFDDIPSEINLQRVSESIILENGDMIFTSPMERCSVVYNLIIKNKVTKLNFRCLICIGYSPSFSSLKELMTGECVQVLPAV